jgi:hypothetical protein
MPLPLPLSLLIKNQMNENGKDCFLKKTYFTTQKKKSVNKYEEMKGKTYQWLASTFLHALPMNLVFFITQTNTSKILLSDTRVIPTRYHGNILESKKSGQSIFYTVQHLWPPV